MLTKSWKEVIERLFEEKVLFEDPSTGIIQLYPAQYVALNKPIPMLGENYINTRSTNLAKAYCALWPPKIMSGGRVIRQGPIAVSKKLYGYIKKNPTVTDEQILNATSRYIYLKAKDNWQFATCSDYFISKDNTSQLEAYILDPELGAKEFEKQTINLTHRKL